MARRGLLRRDGERQPEQTVPAAVVQALRREIIAAPEGAHLGSEAELLARLGVSSPTLRQAARLLEQQQLLKVERGNRGGYFGRRPDAGATARAAALYLEAAETPIGQVRRTARPLMIAAARLAARTVDPARRTAFEAALDAVRALPPGGDCNDLLRCDRALMGEMLRLAGNPAIELFLLVIYRLGRLSEPRLQLFQARPDLAEAWRRHTLRLGEAILEGDPELAALFAARGRDLTNQWMLELAGGAPLGQVATSGLLRGGRPKRSVAHGAAEGLRGLILAQPLGAFLGAEEELASRFKVSRHTLRQAAAMAQHDGLLEIRRGVNGGYVGRRPDIDQVVDAAALYLEFNHGTLHDLMGASQSLAADACRLATAATAPDYDVRLDAARAQMEAVGAAADASPPRSILRAEQALMEAILDLAGNRATQLFVRSLYRYGGMLPQPVRDGRDRIERWRAARLRLIDALRERDGEAAAVICDRVGWMLDEWLG